MTQTPNALNAPPIRSQQEGNPIGPNEAYGEGLVAPGQEQLLQDFIDEQARLQGQQEEQLLLGKFKSVDDLARSYQELEKRLGKGKEEPKAAEPEPQAEVPTYTKEVGVETFGEALAERFEEAGFDPFALSQRLAAGETDLSAASKELAAASGFSEAVAEQFLRGGMAQGQAQGVELGEAEQAEIMALVGGPEQFESLSKWARDGGVESERLEAYNKAVADGNRPAIEAYLLWMAAATEVARLSNVATSVVEPELVSGKTPVVKGFTSRSEIFEAMRKTDAMGNRLYDTDPSYRSQVEALIDRSDLI